MCGRYVMARASADLVAGGGAEPTRLELTPNWNIAPTARVPILVELFDGLAPLYAEVLGDDVDHASDPHAAEHERLVRAVVDGDPDAAAGAVAAVLEPLIDAVDGTT